MTFESRAGAHNDRVVFLRARQIAGRISRDRADEMDLGLRLIMVRWGSSSSGGEAMHYPISILALARTPIEVEMGLECLIYGGTMAW